MASSRPRLIRQNRWFSPYLEDKQRLMMLVTEELDPASIQVQGLEDPTLDSLICIFLPLGDRAALWNATSCSACSSF
jgi:hypothetical protein